MPLADFGKVTFTRATATADGHTGPITDSAWTAERIDLTASAGGYGGPVATGATASTLAAGGSAFSVSWRQSGATAQAYGDGAWGHGHGPGF